MAISLTCECGKKISVKDELAGKRVKCPDCQTVLDVPSPKGASAAEEFDEDEADDAPRLKKKKKKAKKSNKMLWIGAGVGALLLGFCCLGVAGVGGWWFFLRAAPEKPILGKWGLDIEKTKQNNLFFREMFKALPPQMEKELAKMVIEIKSDGTLSMSDAKKNETIKWRNAEANGNTVTLETQKQGANQIWEKVTFRVLDSNSLEFTPPGSAAGSMWLKRL
jgi:hypothetical protein